MFPFRKLAVLLVLVLAAPLAAAGDPPSSHDHHAPAGALQLDHGRRWATTPPLRQGMNGIRKAVVGAVPAHAPRALTAVEARQLADAIRLQVDYLVANCVLAPEADAALHVLLGQMLEGAQALRRNPADEAALQRILAALENYPAYFDDKGWRRLP